MWIFYDISNKISDLYAAIITASRAALLDNLNATISSRAPASSALDASDIAALSNLDMAISDIPGAVKSLETGFVNIGSGGWSTGSGEDAFYTDITVTAVVVAKSQVIWQPGTIGAGGCFATAHLTSTTNLRISMQDNTPGFIRGRWQVVESY